LRKCGLFGIYAEYKPTSFYIVGESNRLIKRIPSPFQFTRMHWQERKVIYVNRGNMLAAPIGQPGNVNRSYTV